MTDLVYIKETNSTNELMWKIIREKSIPEGYLVYTDFQLAGKGQAGNSWEAAKGKNILCSVALFPKTLPIENQFLISQLVSLAIIKTLTNYVQHLSIKWPNDIYWKDRKLGGILIENTIQGKGFKGVVIGIGLNINQNKFISSAPNPISLLEIIGKTTARKSLLLNIKKNILDLYHELDVDKIRTQYANALYRKEGYHLYASENKLFHAKINSIHTDGKLKLELESGEQKSYYFKEVIFVSNNQK